MLYHIFLSVCDFIPGQTGPLPTIGRMDQMGAEGRGGGGGGEGRAGAVIISPYRPKITAACTFISSSRFRLSLTGLAVRAGEDVRSQG